MRLIVGTAGHIDHGKTALVRALTGINTDRLEEEQRRGISIDIGFAHLRLSGPGKSDILLGFVDVPGHERFIKNMLAGASGIDFVILVVAADESVKPQTREHFEICRLLGIQRGIIAITKSDLADPDLLELVRGDIAALVQGSFLENAPVIPVSAKTGAGLEDLRAALLATAQAVNPKDASRPFRLAVDRSFAAKGFGTIVTGTLSVGSLQLEQEVEILPQGIRARVRGLQVHNEPVTKALAGQRTAVNLAGVDHSLIRRGMVLAPPGRFLGVYEFDARLDLIAGAPVLKHRTPVHLHIHTAEAEAQIHLLESLEPVREGSALVRVEMRSPQFVLPGDRFILRRFSPVETIGGGVVLDVHPPEFRKRAQSFERLARWEQANAAGRLAMIVEETAHGAALNYIAERLPLMDQEILALAQPDQNPNLAVLKTNPIWLLDTRWRDRIAQSLRQTVALFHKQNPLKTGLSKEELRARLLPDAPPFVFEAVLAAASDVVTEGDLLRLATHKIKLKEDEQAALDKMEALFATAGLAVPSITEVLSQSGLDPNRARTVLQMLLRNRKLIQISPDLVYHASALANLKAQLTPRKGQRFGVAEFKDWTGVSRKYAIPLLEYLDRERVTRREGESRVVL
jgi:selenocysteine-specific elongation factor